IIGTKSGGPHDRADLPAEQIDRKPRRCGCTRCLETLWTTNLDLKRGTEGPVVEGIEQPLHLEVSQREQIAKSSREKRAPATDSGQPPDNLDSRGAQNVEVERGAFGRADELR